MAHERKCIVDLKDYKYCNHCGEYNPDETWRFLFCCENCKDIYHAIDAFISNKISAKEAKEKLDKCDLSNLDHFQEFVKRDIKRVFEETKDESDTAEIISAVTIEVDESVVSYSVDKTEPVAAPKYKQRKRKAANYKIDE